MADENEEMHEHYHEEDEGTGSSKPKVITKLDGSFGLRDRTDLTIITKDPADGGEIEESFEMPSVLIDMKMLGGAMLAGFIKGYKIVQRETKPIPELEGQ